VLFAPRELPPLRPDISEDPRSYDAWVRAREQSRYGRRSPRAKPSLRLVLPVPGDLDGIRRTLRALSRQTDPGWTLTIAVRERLARRCRLLVLSLGRRLARRTTIVSAPAQAGPRDLFRLGTSPDQSPSTALVLPGDVWAPDTVALLAEELTQHDVVYADEDHIDAAGLHCDPRLKPCYSPDFLLTTGYVGRPLAFRTHLVNGFDPVADSPDTLEHEYALYVCTAASSVGHIPEVLCHRTVLAPRSEERSHVEGALRRRGDPSAVHEGRSAGTYRIERRAPPGVTATVIVPFRDQPQFLRTCVDSVRATAGDSDLELLLVDNGSSDLETLTLLERLAGTEGVEVHHDPQPFNWARLNNQAARSARGAVLLFLNNDIEALRDGWLDALVAHALRPDVGAAGARLLYPNGRLQHCGLVIGLNGAAGHPLVGLDGDAPGYLHMATATRECAAVTGACLATRREVFDELEGFDETLGVDLNDVDYCLRAAQRGYRTIYEPAAELVHHESPSRGTAGGVGDIVRFVERWKEYIERGDTYLSPHLTRRDPSCALATPEEQEAWNQWYSTVTLG
jgi:GT2 family glycosyltransferase